MQDTVRRAELFGMEITSEDTVVDIGSGAGNDCVLAGGAGAEVIAIDIDQGELDHLAGRMRTVAARAFRSIPFDCNDGPIPLPDGTASVVLAKEVMEHLEDPARFLADLVRIGRPGAIYFITVPDPASEALMRIVAPEWYWRKPCHLHVFERDRLDALVRGAGLEIERRAAIGFYHAMWWCLRMAVGTDYFPGHPGYSEPPKVLADWDRVWNALETTPRGAQVSEQLDRLIPKSQIVIARKPRRGRSRVGWDAVRAWIQSQCPASDRLASWRVAGDFYA